ncbi:DUF4864 domain-containing protein [Rhodosalinus sp. K401]|uniref:DUF4864 domain-containing protein n=1 Tax=Rhodosalinus sp. K401 TaxID=3239195 RepID=UPI003524FA15
MRQLLAAFATTLCLATAAPADESAAPAVQGTIQSQIDAFLADDFERAFTFASPGVQGIFRTPENFGRMVRDGYPMVWRPESVRFLDLREISGALWQKVLIEDAEGATHLLDYRMESDEAGNWRIDGVRILRAPDLSV